MVFYEVIKYAVFILALGTRCGSALFLSVCFICYYCLAFHLFFKRDFFFFFNDVNTAVRLSGVEFDPF